MTGTDLLRRLYLWACERLYDEFAWAYDSVAWGVSLGQWDAWRRAALPLRRPGLLLELGFGTGALLAALATQGEPVMGLERSPAMQRVAGRRLRRRGLAVPYLLGEAATLPFAPASFSTVLATFPAPYIAEPATLGEVARVLAPGGILLIGGLWVEPRDWRRMLPFFYAPRPNALLEQLRARMSATGLVMHWREVEAGRAIVGVVVAEKRP